MHLSHIVVAAWARHIKIKSIVWPAHNMILWIIVLGEFWEGVVVARPRLRPVFLRIIERSKPKLVLRFLYDFWWNVILMRPRNLLVSLLRIPVNFVYRPLFRWMFLRRVNVTGIVRARPRNIRHELWIHKFRLCYMWNINGKMRKGSRRKMIGVWIEEGNVFWTRILENLRFYYLPML